MNNTIIFSDTTLNYLVSNKEDASFLKLISGESAFEVERALQILKEYLDK
ncbi:hypothetical protein RU86_GL001151 [Lactococcus piscium]|uniref:Uncharacterized protein n=1 Tax=Pseudolactococcus piscium TaxID=1364 RepID=A0A2A5RVC1_9LACT|nr:hypothetical protein [Lactococcus piscium]PCS05176.1 hypothetical protein RU86_GL001151 [Lactococcus piscium]